MSQNLLENLAEVEVPPPPVDFDKRVHQRLNQWLLVGQISDLVLRGFFFAALHFGRAVFGLMHLTLTGTFESRRK